MSARRLRCRVLGACAAVLGLAGAGQGQEPGPDPALVAADEAAATALRAPGSAGLQVCIARRGEVVVDKGYGLADVAGEWEMRPGTVMHVCSVSKQFVAAAVLRLRDRGLLGLDDPVS